MPRYAIIDDTDPMITYTGNWTVLSMLDPNQPEYNGTVHATNDPDATIELNFYGTVVNAYGTIDAPDKKGLPASRWTLDGKPPVDFPQPNTIGTYDINGTTSHVSIFRSGKFADGAHKLKIEINPASGVNGSPPPMFYLDFFAVLAGDPIYVEDVILDAGNQFTVVDGSWTAQNVTGAYLNSAVVAPLNGGSTWLGFHGTEITVYGTLNGTYNPNATLGYFSIDEGVKKPVYLQNITQVVQTNGQPIGNSDSITNLPGVTMLDNGWISVPTPLMHQAIWRTKGLKDIGDFQHTLTISIEAQRTSTASSSTGSSTGTSSTTSSSTSTSGGPTPAPTVSPWLFDYVVYGPSSAIGSATPVAFQPSGGSSVSSAAERGAIAGGVLGGLAFLTIVIVGILFFLRHKRREEEKRRAPTEYTVPASTNPILAGLRKSFHKSGADKTAEATARAEKGAVRRDEPGVVRQEEPLVLDISANATPQEHSATAQQGSTPLVRRQGSVNVETSTTVTATNTQSPSLGDATAMSAYDYIRPSPGNLYTRDGYFSSSAGNVNAIREVDGGVRLASGDSDESVHAEPSVPILPPQYSRY